MCAVRTRPGQDSAHVTGGERSATLSPPPCRNGGSVPSASTPVPWPHGSRGSRDGAFTRTKHRLPRSRGSVCGLFKLGLVRRVAAVHLRSAYGLGSLLCTRVSAFVIASCAFSLPMLIRISSYAAEQPLLHHRVLEGTIAAIMMSVASEHGEQKAHTSAVHGSRRVYFKMAQLRIREPSVEVAFVTSFSAPYQPALPARARPRPI